MRLEGWLTRNRRPVGLAVVVFGVLWAAAGRWIQDDAFISFTYARSLAEGHGLTWFGERVEGYTNPLWVILLSAGFRLRLDPVLLSQALGLLSFGAALWLTVGLSDAVSPSPLPGLLAVLLLVSNHSVRAYATGGLETMLQAALVTAAIALALGPPRDRLTGRRALAISLLAAAALLTRLDSAALLAVPLLVCLVGSLRRRERAGVLLVLPGALLVALAFAWRLGYYGRFLPNTFAAKVSGAGAEVGLGYVARFLDVYGLWPPLVIAALALALARRRVPEVVPVLAAACLSWFGYVVSVGGDFMEFRFLVPVAPPLFVLLAALVVEAGRLAGRPALLSAVTLAIAFTASRRHERSFAGMADHTMDSVPALASFYGLYPGGDFRPIGEALARELRGLDVRAAVTAAGALPYYSRIPSVDIWGLNDREVAERGTPVPPSYLRPGHRRVASIAYLRSRGVNLVLGHPELKPAGWLTASGARAEVGGFVLSRIPFNREPIGEATVLAIPVDPRRSLLAWVLTPHEGLRARAAERGWERVDVRVRPEAPSSAP